MSAPRALLLAHKPANRRLLAEVVEGEGYEVLALGDIGDAQRHLEEGAGIDLSLVDLDGYPTGILDLCKRLTRSNGPVVVLVGGRTEDIDRATLTAGVHSVLEKPIRKANLQALVGSFSHAD